MPLRSSIAILPAQPTDLWYKEGSPRSKVASSFCFSFTLRFIGGHLCVCGYCSVSIFYPFHNINNMAKGSATPAVANVGESQ